VPQIFVSRIANVSAILKLGQKINSNNFQK